MPELSDRETIKEARGHGEKESGGESKMRVDREDGEDKKVKKEV